MKIPFIDLKRQYIRIKKDIDVAFARVFRRSSFILGPECKEFEDRFSKYVGMPYAVGVNSGTDAIILALRSIGIKTGDEVITVPNTATATVAAIDTAGATPVFVDIEERTCLMDVSKLERAINKKTKAIIPVHLYGNCVEMDRLMEIAEKHKLSVIEDCAQAHGASFRGRKAGTFGCMSCFSFYPTKNLGAYGDAGIILCKSQEICKKLVMFRQYGEDVRYHSLIRGFNSRMDELQAAVLLVKLKYLDAFNGRRKDVADRYLKGIKSKKIILPHHADHVNPVYHLFVVQAENRDDLRQYLGKKGIGTMIHYPLPLHLQPAYAYLGYKEGDFPVAEKVMKRILSIPMFPELDCKEIDYIIKTMNSY